jgi:hypothetical protein
MEQRSSVPLSPRKSAQGNHGVGFARRTKPAAELVGTPDDERAGEQAQQVTRGSGTVPRSSLNTGK